MSFPCSINPWTEEPISHWNWLGGSDTATLLEKACEAQARWAATPIPEKAVRLAALADEITRDRLKLAQLATAEMGKPITQALAEADKCALICRHYATRAATYLADEAISGDWQEARVTMAPLGLILSITPWNFPLWQILRFAVPTLVAGNAVLVKPAPNVVGCATAIVDLARSALGEGVLGMALVDHDAVARLIADNRIAGVALTGSDRAGSTVAALAGAAIKPCLLELGGSDPMIVLADADIPTVARAAAEARFANAGQVCIAAKRIIVEAPIHDDFADAFIAAARDFSPADPTRKDTTMGPMARGDLRDALAGQQQALAQSGGSMLLAGGPVGERGFAYSPTILAFNGDARLGDREAFGPLATLQPARDADEAVRIANDTRYGLSASVWSNDRDRARSVATRITSGSVFINRKPASDPALPIGGIGRSGFGRELGREGVRAFANIKTVVAD